MSGVGSLPQTIPPQAARFGTVDADGNVTIDITWYLLLYNVVTQAISPQNGTITPGPLDLALVDGEDAPPIPPSQQITIPDTYDDPAPDITQLKAAIQAVQALVADLTDYVPGGTSTGSLSVITGSGAPTNGVTGAGISPEGGLYLDQTTPDLYLNCGTMGSPVWKIFGRAG